MTIYINFLKKRGQQIMKHYFIIYLKMKMNYKYMINIFDKI